MTTQSEPTKTCFVVSPIGDADSEVRKRANLVLRIAQEALKEFDYVPVRSDQIAAPGMISHKMIQLLVEAPLVVADLTGANPNVYYELALRHAVGKPVIQLIAKGEVVPFDVADMRTITIETGNAFEAVDNIKAAVRAIEEPGYRVTTPISAALNRPAIR